MSNNITQKTVEHVDKEQAVTCTSTFSSGLQVFSTKQHAVVIVYGYPNILCTEDFLEHLAEVHQEPNKEALLASMRTESESPMFTKSCSDFDEYVELVASNILHHYVPLSAEKRAMGSATEPPKATSSLERQLLLY